MPKVAQVVIRIKENLYPLDHLSYKNEKSITKKDVHQDPSLFRISPVIILNTFICLFLMIWVCLWFPRYSTFVENLVSLLRTLSEYAVVWEFSLLYIIDCSLFFIVFFFFSALRSYYYFQRVSSIILGYIFFFNGTVWFQQIIIKGILLLMLGEILFYTDITVVICYQKSWSGVCANDFTMTPVFSKQ